MTRRIVIVVTAAVGVLFQWADIALTAQRFQDLMSEQPVATHTGCVQVGRSSNYAGMYTTRTLFRCQEGMIYIEGTWCETPTHKVWDFCDPSWKDRYGRPVFLNPVTP